ncbi:MAG: TlpA family protein disulfide reductase, partial [Luminiphilus sp.]
VRCDQPINKTRKLDVFDMEQTMKGLITALITVSSFLTLGAHAAGKNNVVSVNPPVPAPDWTLPAIQNAEGDLSMSDFRGKITYVDFWASWCGPCRLSLPALNSLNEAFSDDPVQFLAISIDVVEEDAWDFLARYAVDYPVVIDTEGDIARLFAVDGMPSGYLLDAEGRVREIHIGFKRGDELKLAESIKKMLAEMDAS